MESFDDLIRRKLAEQPVPDFDEKYWLGAEKLLDEADRKRRRGLFFWIWPLTGLLLVGLGFYAGFSVKNRETVAVENVGTIENQQSSINKNKSEQSGFDNNDTRRDRNLSNENRPIIDSKNTPFFDGTKDNKTPIFNKKGAAPNDRANNLTGDKKGGNRAGQSGFLAQNLTENSGPKFEDKPADPAENRSGGGVMADAKLDANPVAGSAQTVENQSVASAGRDFFLLEFLKNRPIRWPLEFVRRTPKLPFFNINEAPAPVIRHEKNRIHFGVQAAGFASKKDNSNKRINGVQLGVFVQKKLYKRLTGQLFVDYKLIGGLNESFSLDTIVVNQFRFGLETIAGQPVPIYFHQIVPGINFRYQIYRNQWAEIGFSERIWYGSRVKLNKIERSPFGAARESSVNGYSTKNNGWNKFVPEMRLGLSTDLGRNLQVSIGYKRQFKTIGRSGQPDTNGRYFSKNWFDVKLRYILY